MSSFMSSSSPSSTMFQSLLLVVSLGLATVGVAKNSSRAFFVFGDSLVDSGNNNYLATVARADSPPYGVDYPNHLPTGRFSNGYNIPDIMCQEVGLEAPLPYLSPKLRGRKLMVGANFASAGIGILEDTGIQFANIIKLHKQLKFFEEYQSRASSLIGEQQTQTLVNKALFLVTVGGNDFVNNYFLTPMSARRVQYNLQDFSQLLVSKFREFLQRLYTLGARRVIVTGTGPIGCTPTEIALRSPNGQCAPELQLAASIYNPMLVKMTTELNHELGSNIFISANAMKMHYDFITNPRAYGFVKSNVACCGQGPYNGIGLCIPTSNLCKNRDEYVFWDAFHPTERANRFIVQLILSGSEEYMTPMNLSTIMVLDSRA